MRDFFAFLRRTSRLWREFPAATNRSLDLVLFHPDFDYRILNRPREIAEFAHDVENFSKRNAMDFEGKRPTLIISGITKWICWSICDAARSCWDVDYIYALSFRVQRLGFMRKKGEGAIFIGLTELDLRKYDGIQLLFNGLSSDIRWGRYAPG